MRARVTQVPAPLALAIALVFGCGGSLGGGTRGPLDLIVDGDDGRIIDTGGFRGDVVVLHLFTVGSLAAVADVDQLNAASERDGVVVIGIALDPDAATFLAPWRAESGATYRLGVGGANIVQGHSPLGEINAVPQTLVLDRGGNVATRWRRRLAPDELSRALDRAVASE